MEVRPSRSRGGGWKRGGRGGHDGDSSGGEHRGRGRGGHNRGRGKRDHYRGRGRGGGAHAAEFHYRDQDGGDDNVEEDDDDNNRKEVFSRRKLGSNWDRYEESERQEADDTPAQRGADYHVLLESAGDSFTQFRFLEERDWEMDSLAAGQMSAVFVDLPALAQTLQQVPLHQRLHLEAELVQVSTPVELPTMKPATEQETAKMSTFTPASATLKHLDTDQKVPVSTNPVDDEDEHDDELDQLLSLQKPVLHVSGDGTDGETGEGRAGPEEAACEEIKEVKEDEMEEEEVGDADAVAPPESTSVKQEMTEDDLEDWLDSMIS